jgi:hypothetical protein
MKRVFVAALICAAFFVTWHGRAQAMTEFCPARLHIAGVSPDGVGHAAPRSLYGFDLFALGSRNVSATIAFDTSAGWFEIDVPQQPLTLKLRHYHTPYVKFVRRDYVSPVIYVQFPNDVALNHVWVYSATAQDDGAFGWAPRGLVSCAPPTGANPYYDRSSMIAEQMDPRDADNLEKAPGAGSMVLTAVQTSPLETADCKKPFSDAGVKWASAPAYPDTLRAQDAGLFSVSATVAITSDGTAADAWISVPSGYRDADDAVIRAAKGSVYNAGRAYCRNVPGVYTFSVTFDPNQ